MVQPKVSPPVLEFDTDEEKGTKKSPNSAAAKKKKILPPKKGQGQSKGQLDVQDWNIDVPWNVDVPSAIWKDPSLLVKGEGTPQERLVSLDESCRNEMHSLLHGRPEDVDEAWASSWVEALMMEGETPLQTLRCIAFNGMPQVCGAIDCEGGKGLLILSKLSDSKHRLHFVFQEQQQEIDAREEMSMHSKSLTSTGCFCGSSMMTSSEAALAQHSSTYKMLHRTIALEVEGNILLAHTEMRNLAKKTTNFDTSSSHHEEHHTECPKLPCCLMCKLTCPCFLCCCPTLPCCQVVGEPVNVERTWGNTWGNSAMFKRSFPCDEETCEDREVTYTFPASPEKEWPGREYRTSKTAQMHLLSILYCLPGSATSSKFTAWIDPCHSVKSNARFAHELSASAKVDHAACRVSEPSPLAASFAQQFQFFAGTFLFSSGSTSSSSQSNTQAKTRQSITQAFLLLPCWKKLLLAGLVVLIFIIAIALAT